MNTLLHVSLRQQAIFIPQTAIKNDPALMSGNAAMLVANLAKLGFGVSEPLLKALNRTTPVFLSNTLETFRKIMGLHKNWTPLVKGWDTPTGESAVDHLITLFANIFKWEGTKLPCNHIIPNNTFPLERYNGCPFCGTPFEFGRIEHYRQGSKLKVLDLWNETDINSLLCDLLESKTALDATQMDSLKILLAELPLPDVKIGMKETLMAVIDILIDQGHSEKAQALFTSPTDILRYLWYKQTGFLQIIEPKTIIKRQASNNKHIGWQTDKSGIAKLNAVASLKLKYNRQYSAMVAGWLNNVEMSIEQMCETMHPKRGMWVRFIRALRLPEYSKRKGFEKLNSLLDSFYNQSYNVWQGKVNHYRLRSDAENTFSLLKQRPGLFARSLFANMLWFGNEAAIEAFKQIIDKVPARLVFTLNMYAENYFDKTHKRAVKPLGGINKSVPANRMLSLYDDKQLEAMKEAVVDLCLFAVRKRFAAVENINIYIYIDPILYKMPVAIGDRSDNVQDLPAALMGSRFEVEGDTVRLFMQWGTGLPAQHMDMDLSCIVAYEDKVHRCSYSSLVITGCKHSGDIRSIPEKIGTAEYIDININVLRQEKAKYVTFTSNAYSYGSITPNMVVGWMNSKYPMKISEKTGVAYDPSCVQHQVRITNSLAKGLVFGVLDVEQQEIIWLELPFAGQIVQNLDLKNVEALLKKLNSKLSIGQLLRIKAEAQNMQIVDAAEKADESYTKEWGLNTAAVTKLLID